MLVFLVLALFAINPKIDNKGVIINTIQKEGPADLAGMSSPDPKSTPLSREVIKSINNVNINDIEDYYKFIEKLNPSQKVSVVTDKNIYKLELQNSSSKNPLGLSVSQAPNSNIRKGLDLQGGTRVLLEPSEKIPNEDMELIIANLKQRLNVYGLSDIIIRKVTDTSGLFGDGNQYILVEIAGVNEEEVKDLISKQGKFVAKIGNKSVFSGGNDITYVCRSSQCSGLDQTNPCRPLSEGGYGCGFMFSITLSTKAAKNQANITKNLETIYVDNNEYLNETLDFYLDDEKVNSLNIASSLKGEAATDIAISGGSSGKTKQEAAYNALTEMKQMQTVLITGSLPVKLNILKTDTLSPSLGGEFLKNALHIGILSILAVAVVIFIRYRKLSVSLPVVLTMFSEIIILLGFASLVGWNLDLAAIAGIIIAAGTGVDDQIVITDETIKSKKNQYLNWKQKLKRAFFIIMAAYFTTVVAMVPLLFAGAGLLKGFAFTTIVGVSVGVFITRPAFAAMIKIFLNK